jgi:hypothetical protein
LVPGDTDTALQRVSHELVTSPILLMYREAREGAAMMVSAGSPENGVKRNSDIGTK